MAILRFILVLFAMSSSAMAANMRSSNVGTDSEIRLGLGYINGKASSSFYDVDGVTFGTPGYRVRKVDWKLDNIPMAGVGYSLGIGKSIHLNLDYWTNAADGDATTKYYNWGIAGRDWSDSSTHPKTSVNKLQFIDLSGEYTFSTSGRRRRGARNSWSAIVGYRNDVLDTQAKGGSGTLTTTTFRDTNVAYPDSPVISYQQTLAVPYLGLRFTSITRSRREKYNIRFSMLYSLWAGGDDIMTDYSRNQKYEEKGSGGEWYKVALEMDFELSKRMMYTIGYSKQNYSEIKGTLLNTNVTNGTTALYPNESAGMSNQTDLISLGINYHF